MTSTDDQLWKPMVRLGVGKEIPALLQRFGVEPSSFLRDRGLDIAHFTDPNTPIEFAALANLVSDAASATDCEHFGLLVGGAGDLATLGRIGSAAAKAPNAGAALTLIMTQFESHNRGAIISIDAADDPCLSYNVVDPNVRSGEAVSDGALAITMRVMSELCGPKFTPLAVELPRRAPADRSPYERTFRCRVSFNAPTARMHFDRKWFVRPIEKQASTPMLADDERLALVGDDILVNRVAVEISHRLVSNLDLSVDDVACALGMSRRTLHRELSKSNRTFHSISHDVRFASAKRLLHDTEVPLTQIATSLGYSELSAFTRAFTRSFGECPSDWRGKQKTALDQRSPASDARNAAPTSRDAHAKLKV